MNARAFWLLSGLISGLIAPLLFQISPASAQSDRVVALVVSVGDGKERADAIQTQLQLIGAETLRANAPSNAQLRSILMRFAREAANSRASFIYIDAPVISFEGRGFILPDGARLNRPTDIFTQAIPIQAFSRSAVQAEQGGAAVITVVSPSDSLLQGLEIVTKAPEPVPGASPVLISNADAFASILETIELSAGNDEIEIGDLLKRMANDAAITVSDLPRNRIFLREPPKAEPEQPIALPAAVTEPTVSTEDTASVESSSQEAPASSEQSAAVEAAQTDVPQQPEETIEELELLEQSLSRAAKRTIQKELRKLTHYKGLVDGIFGPQTRDAIKAFQNSRSEDETGVLNRRQLLDLSS